MGASLRSLSSVRSASDGFGAWHTASGLSWCHVTRAPRPRLHVSQGLRPSLKFTLATAGGSPSPLHEFCTLTPCPSQTLPCRPALTLCPLLDPDLSLTSGLWAASAV